VPDQFPWSLEDAVLDNLVDGRESPWVVHAELVHVYGFGDVDVDEVIAILTGFVQKGWASPDHPEAPTDAFWKEALAGYSKWLGPAAYSRIGPNTYYPDYGPWYALTEKGRREWERRTNPK
jgi:hypothetical protein